MQKTRLFGLIGIAAFFAAIFFGLAHAQDIEDWMKLRNYTPPATVSALASEDTMSPYARHVFYVNHPQLEKEAGTFRQQCSQAEQTIVLGCYHSGQNGIDIYDVQDPRLQGVQQVTAAHEMLHAIYDRLDGKEKTKVDNMLMDYYKNDLKDERVMKVIDSYKKSEPNDVVNEMHSIFGTEVANLPAPLESYYDKYFSNRSKIVDYANSYEGEFTKREAEIEAYDTQLAALKDQIAQEESNLQQQLQSLQADRARVENSNDENEINLYNARVEAYNQGVRQLHSDISTYNDIVEKRNAIAAELKSLQSSIDTRLQAQPTH